MAEAPAGTHDDLAAVLDIGQVAALVQWFTDALVEALPIEDADLEAIKALPMSLRIAVTVRLQESLDLLRNVVATLALATIELGLDQ